MAISSRKTLLPRQSTKTISGWWLFAVFVSLMGALCIYPTGRLFASFVCFVIVVSFCLSKVQTRRLQKMAKCRQKDSICTFARSFDCRKVDTRIIRATYEELQDYHSSYVPDFPVRATDFFEKDLILDGEDLDYVAVDIAKRAHRSMENVVQNPMFGKVKTVGDLVLLLNHQPLQDGN